MLNPAERHSEFLATLICALEQLDTMAGVLDTQGRFIFANRAALKNIGSTREQIRGFPFSESPWLSNHSPEARKAMDEMIAKALAGEPSVIEDEIIDSDGRLIQVLFSISPFRDTGGKIIALIPEAKVISKLKNLPNRLEKERWETQQWIDSMGAFVVKCDPKGRIVGCNMPFLAMLNMELEEIVGHYICDTVGWLGYSGKDREQLRKAVRDAGKGEKSSVEAKLTLTGNSQGTFLFNASPILNATGQISFVALEITDISEQVILRELMLTKEKKYSSRLEKEVDKVTTALRETEQFNKNLIDSTPLGIIYLNNNDRVMFVNSEMEQKLKAAGVSGDCILGKKLHELLVFLADSSWKKIADLHKQRIHYGQMRMHLCSKEDNRRQFEVHAAPLRSSMGDVEGTILIMADVTERNRMEEELLRTRIQSEKMSSLELLISGVAHELNNPLTSIIGCAEYLVENTNFSKEAGEAARIIISDAGRAGEIVKNLLAFAIQSASEESTVNLNEVITNVVGIRIHELRNQRIKAVLELDQNIQPVEADVTQMQQVVLNLMSNAADAVGESGVGDLITIRTRTEGSWVLMDIEDNGPGIQEKYLSKIFDPFFTTKQPGRGTGLGLSIAYGIIQRHGGSITVNTAPDSGTCFTIGFPLFVSPWRRQSRNLPSPAWIPSRALIVDDEVNVCKTLSRYLIEIGCKVDTAMNGSEALDRINKEVYDLLLVDIKMPEMSGLELYRKLRVEHPEIAERLAFMTGASGQEMHSAIKSTGVSLLQKPFNRQEILKFFSLFAVTQSKLAM